ncbi:MAG: penicillin-binding protein 1C [Pseudomonadota bacterium]
MKKRRIIAKGCLAGLAAGLLLVLFCPKPSLYGDTSFSVAVLDRDGRLLRLALADDERYRLRTRLADINQVAVEATLRYEDQHFYHHPGFNPASLVRAAWSTYVKDTRPIGASTITMQLARMRFDLNTRTVGGKLLQIARAIQIERHYSKDDILEAYLNLAPYGGNIEGIGTASLTYFDKLPTALSKPEAMALAVIPQNPVARDVSTTTGYQAMSAARARLFETWDEAEQDDVTREQLVLPLAVRPASQLPFRAPHFVQSILASTDDTQEAVTTTLSLDAQTLLERQIRRYVDRHRSRGITNASALLIDHRSMSVLASVGSADFFDDTIFGQVDGTRAKRSPGSTLKPFVYGMAIDQGHIHPGSLLKDAPRRFAAYTPENFDRGFLGPIKAQDALIYSRNVPAVDLLSRVGLDAFHDFLTRAGVSGLAHPDHYGLAMVLGGNEVTMRELVAQYAMLENRGMHKLLRSRQTDPVAPSGEQLLSPEASFLVLEMLRANPKPGALGLPSNRLDTPVAWKTGTSYAYRDAWTVGTFGPYVLAIWVGNFDGSANPEFVGRGAAAPLFFETVDALAVDRLAAPPHAVDHADLNVKKVAVCADSGDLPGRHCPRTAEAWFIPGVSPIRVSDVHRAIRIDRETGLRACDFDNTNSQEIVVEFWPSDILALYQQAGITVQSPPAWSPDCSLSFKGATGAAPRIGSPTKGVTYQLRQDPVADDIIPLTAIVDSDVERLFWFVNDQYLQSVKPEQPVLWKPEIGEHQVLVVDDLGRSHSQQVFVTSAQ